MTTSDIRDADSKAVESLIIAFFEAINSADIPALKSLFFHKSTLCIVRQDPPLEVTTRPPPPPENKLNVVIRTDIETFAKLLEDAERKRREDGKKGPVLVETPDLKATRIETDGGSFASAWTPFRVTFDGVLHHYGNMVYNLGKDEDGSWKVLGLTQSYRRTPGWDDSHPDLM